MKINIDKITNEPMNDFDIKHYLEKPTIKYSELINYNSIDELLPNDIDYQIILIESDFNNGHWVGILKYNNIIEYFDAYGKEPSEPLSWISKKKNIELGQNKKFLNILFDKSNKKVIYNDIDYQIENPNINTCGAHITFRILQLLENGKTLKEYNKLMQKGKKETKLNYDQIVAAFINRRNS